MKVTENSKCPKCGHNHNLNNYSCPKCGYERYISKGCLFTLVLAATVYFVLTLSCENGTEVCALFTVLKLRFQPACLPVFNINTLKENRPLKG